MDLDERIGSLIAQRKQIKLEVSELEDALVIREKTLNKIDGALELAEALKKDKKPKKKEKQNG
tara:strand:+ start:2372 stop:2560 length:189 start_codon:yes stop_codon:yes gene_type:complete